MVNNSVAILTIQPGTRSSSGCVVLEPGLKRWSHTQSQRAERSPRYLRVSQCDRLLTE
jgi:hypothetical protein